jgi:hypothetical protein
MPKSSATYAIVALFTALFFKSLAVSLHYVTHLAHFLPTNPHIISPRICIIIPASLGLSLNNPNIIAIPPGLIPPPIGPPGMGKAA